MKYKCFLKKELWAIKVLALKLNSNTFFKIITTLKHK